MKGDDGNYVHVNNSHSKKVKPECIEFEKSMHRDYNLNPKSTIPSLFNCDLESSPCVYFYPAKFLDPQCGLGSSYHRDVLDMMEMQRNGTLWRNMPSVGFPTFPFRTSLTKSVNRTEPFLDETISFLHVHKSGGTTLHQAFNNLAKISQQYVIRHHFFVPKKGGIPDHHQPPPRLTVPPTHRPLGLEDDDGPVPGPNYNNTDDDAIDDNDDFTKSLQRKILPKQRKNNHIFKVQTKQLQQRKLPFKFDDSDRAKAERDGTSLRLRFQNVEGNTTLQQQQQQQQQQQRLKAPVRPKNTTEFTIQALNRAILYPPNSKPFLEPLDQEHHVIFAMVRDPTERFISSVGQALGATGSQGNGIGKVIKRECLRSSTQESLRCIIKYVKTYSIWIELHFAPQILDIHFATMYMDVPIAIFPFKTLNKVIEYFGLPNLHHRDGKKENYRPNEVLTNMSTKDYDDDMLRDVCELYEMDVIMQRSLGFQVPSCDPFIP